MKKDIVPPTVEDVAVAIIKEENEEGGMEWNAFLINLKNEKMQGVLVTSHGYGFFDGKDVKTTTLRHFLDEIKPGGFSKIEPVVEDLFGLNNEYWVSFYVKDVMYDKKYIFLPETIKEENFILVPSINKKGVMIK